MKLPVLLTQGPLKVDLAPVMRKYGGCEDLGSCYIIIHEGDDRWPVLIKAIERLTEIAESVEEKQ